MRHHVLAVLTAALLSTGTLAAWAAPAAADTPGCVTRSEYRSVHRGDTMTHVHAVFDTRGKRMSYAESGGYAAQVRTYRVCGSSFSVVSIAFDKNPGGVFRLSAKSAVWVY